MPGSGIRSYNIKAIVDYTGATEVHSSSRKNISTEMEFVNENMKEILQNISVDEDEIKKMKTALNA
jgi:copper homeostasis protein